MEDIITRLKAVRISIKSEQDSEGIWHSWPVDAPGLWGQGKDIPESINDMIQNWREALEVFAWTKRTPAPEDLLFYMKVLASSDEELKSCLSEKNCAVP